MTFGKRIVINAVRVPRDKICHLRVIGQRQQQFFMKFAALFANAFDRLVRLAQLFQPLQRFRQRPLNGTAGTGRSSAGILCRPFLPDTLINRLIPVCPLCAFARLIRLACPVHRKIPA